VAFKLGQHVRIKPNVSRCVDEGSLQHSATVANALGIPEVSGAGVSRKHLAGKTGVIVQIGTDVLPVKERVGVRDRDSVTISEKTVTEAPASVPPGHEGHYLIDSQIRPNGFREGRDAHFREWIAEAELEPVS
jgi:hypothetical protein